MSLSTSNIFPILSFSFSSSSPSFSPGNSSLLANFQNSKILFLWLFISAMYILAFLIFLVKFSVFNSAAFTSSSIFLYSFLIESNLVTISIMSSIVYTFFSTNSYVTTSFWSACISSCSSSLFTFLFIETTSFFFLPFKKYLTFPKKVFLHSKKVDICFCFSKYSAFCSSIFFFNFFNKASFLAFSLIIFFISSVLSLAWLFINSGKFS